MAKNFTKLNHKNFPLWKKKIRKNLSIEDKLIYFSLMANPQTDYRGIFEIETDDLIKTGIKIDKIEKAFINLEKYELIKYDEENGIILIPEMVKTQKWGQNEILSILNYVKDEIDSFLILDLIDILQTLDLTDKAKGYLLELQGLSKGYQRGIKGVGVPLAIDKNKNKIRIDKDIDKNKNRVDKDKDKDKEALLQKDALDIYKFYFDNIKGGARKETLKSLINILKDYKKDDIIVAIQNYIIKQQELGNRDLKFYKAPQFFFSKANEFYKDYLGYDLNKRKMFLQEIFNIDRNKDIEYIKNELARIKDNYINFITEKEIKEAWSIISNNDVI